MTVSVNLYQSPVRIMNRVKVDWLKFSLRYKKKYKRPEKFFNACGISRNCAWWNESVNTRKSLSSSLRSICLISCLTRRLRKKFLRFKLQIINYGMHIRPLSSRCERVRRGKGGRRTEELNAEWTRDKTGERWNDSLRPLHTYIAAAALRDARLFFSL